MNESAVLTRTNGDTGALGLWLLGASAVGSVVPGVLLTAIGGGAIMIVWALDLTRGVGTGVYLIACVCCVAAYWAVLHGAMRTMSRLTDVPRVVWPALLVWPVIWIAVSVFADPRDVLEPASAVMGAAGVILAWFTSGRSRVARGRFEHA